MKAFVRSLGVVLFLLLPLVLGAACKKSRAGSTEERIPKIVVRATSADLIFTWVDARGKFGTGQEIKDVPEDARDLVRVRDPVQDEDGEHIVLVDLRSVSADGTYPTRVGLKKDFDETARTRRAQNGSKTIDPNAPPPAGTTVAGASASAGAGAAGQAKAVVIIYGASWCSACHEAAAWLKKKGIAYVEKDIEKDSSADREMRSKLSKSGRRGSSIPVIDVKGTILVGFSPREIERALGT